MAGALGMTPRRRSGSRRARLPGVKASAAPQEKPRRTRRRTPAVLEFSFDARYYRRYYGNPRTCVADRESCALLADFVFAYLAYLRLPVARVLDLGCGIGLWREQLLQHHPRALYVGVEKSPYACRKHGWERGSVVDYRASDDFDLVICQDVLQYLDDGEAAAALRNLARLAGSALYLQALTRGDWEHACDQGLTDGGVYLRNVSWYRNRLRRRFRDCGGGLFLARSMPAVLFDLEHRG